MNVDEYYRFLLILLAFTLASVAVKSVRAQPCTEASATIPGQLVPCVGQLLPDEWARAGLKCLKIDVPLARESAKLDLEVCEAGADGCRTKLSACLVALSTAESVTVPPQQEAKAWYEHPLVQAGVVVAVFAGGVAFGAMVVSD